MSGVGPAVNETHDPASRSWVASANQPGTDFPIQNLPFGIFRRAGTPEPFRGGVAIGDWIVDLRALSERHPFDDTANDALAACCDTSLNRFMAMARPAHSHLRGCLSDALRYGSAFAQSWQEVLVPQAEAEFGLPAGIGDYTDFYTSIHHATAVGRRFRPENPLLPNYRWLPIAYHGRSSSIGVSGQTFRRPVGQTKPHEAQQPVLGPSRQLDFELEVGLFIGMENAAGTPIPIEEAEDHVFGLCLLNDWSARDIQAWEYQPLGPFLAKNFATTISPWIVTLDALAPYRLPFSRAADDPPLLPYLDGPSVRAAGALDIQLEISLQSARMREQRLAAQPLAASNLKYAYWTMGQMVAHHTVNGCNLRAGDLLGSGTLSGPLPAEAGSLLELTAGGTNEICLASGETRRFLEDGDRIEIRGWCERPGSARIGFGVSSGTILPAAASGHADPGMRSITIAMP